ncbi:MAG: chromosome segregation protein [Flavobacteriaceae bacterium]|nr:MAG: chromosome segregation protein [Flavobacteriaceae bacterium]
MLDESKIIPSEEENNETPQTSEIQEEKTPINLTTDGISSKNEVVEENEKEELPKVEESILVTKNSDKNEEPMVLSKVETSSGNEAIDEIETKIAESSEKIAHTSIEMLDYESLSLEDLVTELSKLVKEHPVQNIHNNVNKIKNSFNIKFGEVLKNEKTKFIENGGDVIDFKYSNPVKSNYNSILYDYKIKKTEFYAKQDSQLDENLKNKLLIIEDLKNLINNADGTTMYKSFKDIQSKWREIGPIPKAKYNNTWRTYEHHVERFYDLLHLSNDLRDLDFKHNYEEKLALVVKAEELAELEDINLAFNELQILHKLWKEEVGPVGREHREEVWDRFSAATKKVHDKRHEFFKDLRSKFDDNVDEKLAVISSIEAIDISNNKSRTDWQKSIKELEGLRSKFFSIGNVPRTKSNEIWSKFKEVTKKFNVEKNNFFKEVKNEHLENLNQKKLLIERAVALKDSEDWDVATEVMKKIQADWKNIGHVPRKYSDKLWKEFKDACNHYFDRLHSEQDAGNKVEMGVFIKKKELLAQIKSAVEDGEEITLDNLKEYVSDWRNLGRVPFEMKHIEVKFNKVIDKIVKSSTIEAKDVEMIKFENLVNSYLEQKNYHKLNNEQLFVRKKVDETVREIQQLENNIGFISNATADNPLLKNVMDNIAVYKQKLEVWKIKLEFLKKLEY